MQSNEPSPSSSFHIYKTPSGGPNIEPHYSRKSTIPKTKYKLRRLVANKSNSSILSINGGYKHVLSSI